MTKIYPAIDIIEGRCVRLHKGDFKQVSTYNVSPLAQAKLYEDQGFRYIHIVDLDAARGTGDNRKIIESIVSQTSLKVQTGGGLRTSDQVANLLDIGVERLILGSVSVSSPELVSQLAEAYGWTKFVLGADTLDGSIMVHGWKEASPITVENYIKQYRDAGANSFLCTEISKDGTLQGPDFNLYNQLLSLYSDIELIGSGGVGELDDVTKLIQSGVRSVIIGKAIYEGRISLESLSKLQK